MRNRIIGRFQSRALYLADLAVGRAMGARCPSCGSTDRERRIPKLAGLGNVYRCRSCALLFRPTGLMLPAVAKWYYSHVYGDAGLATTPDAVEDSSRVARMVKAENKDRSSLLRSYVAAPAAASVRVCVFGCSWGYEISLLRSAGFDAYGIELGTERRLFGENHLGVRIFESIDSAAAQGAPDILLSSHVLEHIPQLDATLQELSRALRPKLHVHITPNVEPEVEVSIVRSSVGREHPLGVTRAFWCRWAERFNYSVTFDSAVSETIVVLRNRAVAV